MTETILLFLLLFFIFLGVSQPKFIIPITIISFLWISSGIRIFGITWLNFLLLSFILFSIFKRTFLSKSKGINKFVSQLILYVMFITIPFMFLSNGLPLALQLRGVKSLFLYLVLFTLWNNNIKFKNIHKINSFIIISILALCIYGIFSYITSSNIYLDLTSSLYGDYTFDVVGAAEGALGDQRGVLKGRITGTTPHTIQYSILMGITCFYLVGIRRYFNRSLISFLIVLCFINAVMTGSRGPIFGIIVGLFIFIMKSFSFRMKLCIITGGLLMYLSSNVLTSLFSHEGGSSLEMRMIQISGCWLEINKSIQSILFGLGHGYNVFYLTNYGVHPMSLGFEGRFLAGLVNYGIIGSLFIIIGTWIMEFRLVRNAFRLKLLTKDDKYCLYGLIVFEMIYSSIDGTAYTLYFLVVFLLIIKYAILRTSNIDNLSN